MALTYSVRVAFHIIKLAIPEWDEKMDESIEGDTWYAPLFYIIFIVGAELVPVMAQLNIFTFVMSQSSLKVVLDRNRQNRHSLFTSDLSPRSDPGSIEETQAL